ncbi:MULTISPECIES: globin-coupled sensor protein [Bombella]|uniref:Globin-coupled sensor protein n=1 Tax=Bombella pollinis TaxID=2967337 RepID=A0ABT3WRZ6_9PROT|nr:MULTISPECIES: globin-coupled sensor protein [Bombella]MCX5619616.1 globin-coupled sensor protein [Bombella pollinis]MUG89818.1 globin-coupled sensor protein [Bombella sp. ESL0385]
MPTISTAITHDNKPLDDSVNLPSRLHFLGLTEKECQIIRRIEPYITKAIPHALDIFYDLVAKEPKTKIFFSSKQHMQQAKQAQLGYWRHIALANFGTQFADTVRRVGKTHARIGLEPRWYIGGYAVILSHIIQDVTAQLVPAVPFLPPKLPLRELASSFACLLKAVFLDVDLTISIYIEETKRSNKEEMAKLDNAIEQERQFVTQSFGHIINALADKNLSLSVEGDLPTTYLPMRDDLNHAIATLCQTLNIIKETTGSIDNTADEINSAARDLARRTEKQAASVEKTAAAVEQITATVSSTAARVLEANHFVKDCQTATEHFGTMIHRAHEAMKGIERSAEAVNKITNVISNIATQTNLLALNTGVEAAHAGEAGSGFRVLAQEIRKLANRVGNASEEVKELISTSQNHVTAGSSIMKDASNAVGTIISNVANINSHLQEITKATSEQASALKDVNSAIATIDQGTRENAAMVEETSAATANMAQRTRQLRHLLGEFTLQN